MATEFKTKGIILRKKEWREADLLFYIYSENFGKIEIMATGVRKAKSKLAGHLASPGIVELNFVKGKAFFRLTHAFLHNQWKFKSADDFYLYSAIMEIVDKTIREGESNERIWKLILWACENIIKADKLAKKILVLNIFIIKLLTQIGYEIRTEKCGQCGNAFETSAKYDFNSNHFYCGKCSQIGRFISLNGINVVNATKLQQPLILKLSEKEIFELNSFLVDYMEYYTERSFMGMRFFASIKSSEHQK